MSRLDGTRALVTGSGGTGSIGRATVLALAEEGADVVVNDLASREAEANDAKAWLILDTGNSAGILIKSSFAADKGWLNDDNSGVSQQDSKGIVDSSSVQSFRLNSLRIGPYDLENVLVATPSEDQMANIGRYASESNLGTRIKSGVQAKGLIGYDILKHFVVTID